MRLTIEWLRTLVLAAGVLLVLALGAFLAVAKYKRQFNVRELPKKLGIDIQQEANGVTYSHALGSHSQFKIHASKVVQLKNDHALLHDVKIELFGEDGSRLDRIEGDEFEYDQKNGTATATGPVAITMMRPGVAPAIAPKATASKVVHDKAIAKPLASAAETAAKGEVHIKTSGLTFDYRTGVTTTNARVDFQLTQGEGSSMGATYDSQKGVLVLDHAVEMTTARAGNTVAIHAQHAEFDRDDLVCRLHAAKADYREGQASATEAKILFRQDGSAVRLDATNGFTIDSGAGGHIAAPTGSLDFDEHNQPRHGHLEGGVQMDSSNETTKGTRKIQGSAPTANLEFNGQGQLRHAHLERGVEMTSEDRSMTAATAKAAAEPLRASRTWRAPVTDVEFRNAKQRGQVEPATIHGMGGVVITAESQRGKAVPVPSKLSADELSGDFGPNSALTTMTGTGHASIAETTATGSRQTASGDRLQAHFTAGALKTDAPKIGLGGAAQIDQATLDGHVVLTQTPAAKPGGAAQAEMKATAGKVVYEGAGEWLHLTVNPRVEDGAIELTADKIDVSQQSGDALAHGNVKATWLDAGSNANGKTQNATAKDTMALGGQGPAHAIAQQAELHRAINEAVFTGHARMWQQANSIQGPMIVLDRTKKSLVAHSTDAGEPVRVVLLSDTGIGTAMDAKASGSSAAKPAIPSVIRVHGGELDYSDIERKAEMLGGSLGPVVAETGTATSSSNRVDLYLVPSGVRPGKDAAQGQVDHMTASGNVVLTSDGRRGTGEQLTYTGRNAQYVLTGTPAATPRMTDSTRGSVTGEALIFNGRDDSVTIEGGGHETRTETTVRQGEGRSETQK